MRRDLVVLFVALSCIALVAPASPVSASSSTFTTIELSLEAQRSEYVWRQTHVAHALVTNTGASTAHNVTVNIFLCAHNDDLHTCRSLGFGVIAAIAPGATAAYDRQWYPNGIVGDVDVYAIAGAEDSSDASGHASDYVLVEGNGGFID